MNKRALLVGIDHYTPLLGDQVELGGCVNDVEDFADMLLRFGYNHNMIKIITNERANKQNILQGLNWLYNSSGPTDYIIFYFAGYGSQMIEKSDNTYDGSLTFEGKEVLCPYDIDFESRNYITDIELRNIFTRPLDPPGKIEFILDCGLSQVKPIKSKYQGGDKAGVAHLKNRSLATPLDFNFYANYDFFLPVERLLKVPEQQEQHKIFLPNSWPFVVWLGSRNNQSCYETNIDGATRGIFTYNFCKAMRDSNMKTSRGILYGLTNTYMERAEVGQSALLQTSSETEVSSPFDFPPDPNP
jgi:metacaspase-1